MIVDKKLKGKTEFVKTGNFKKLRIFKGVMKEDTLAELVIDKEKEELRIIKGTDAHLLLTEIGIQEETKLDIILVNAENLLIRIHWGSVYIRESENKVRKVDEKYTIEIIEDEEKIKGIKWFRGEELITIIKRFFKYRLENFTEASFSNKYYDLIYEVILSNYMRESVLNITTEPTFTVKIKQVYAEMMEEEDIEKFFSDEVGKHKKN